MIENKLCDDSDNDREVKDSVYYNKYYIGMFAKCTRVVKLRLFRSYCLFL